MIRRLIKQGQTSMVVSLPIEWIRSQKLKAGDELEVLHRDNKVEINTLEDKKLRRYNLKVDELDEYAVYINLLNLYQKGYDEIKIISKTKKIHNYKTGRKIDAFKSIKTWLPRFIGWEFTTQDPIIIKDITGESSENPRKLLNRIFFILNSFVDEELMALKNKTDMPDANEFYMTVFKLINYAIRTYNKRPKTSYRVSLLQEIHRIAQQLRDIQPYLKSNQKAIIPILSLLRPALKLYTSGEITSFIKEHYVIGLKLNKLRISNELLRMLLTLHGLYMDVVYTTNFLQIKKEAGKMDQIPFG
jgi:hypothetical protein